MPERTDCGESSCGCGVNRRDFVKLAGLTAVGTLFARLPVMAGPFDGANFEKLVPADKKLNADWIKSMFARGTPTIYRGEELNFIGMPVGGICSGQLYLGGDGKLWHWDIFNQLIRTDAAHYAHPMQPSSPLEQGFVLTTGTKTRALDKTGIADIRFRGEYPIGIIEYRDQDVHIVQESFSPFIPLNTDDSSLPATVMQFTVKNTGTQKLEAELTGHLENAVCLYHREYAGMRRNRIVRGNGLTFLDCAAIQSGPPKVGKLPDFGTMGLGLIGAAADRESDGTTPPPGDKLIGELGRRLSLDPGQSGVVTFVLTWHFPNLALAPGPHGRFYGTKFNSALAVAEYVSSNFDRLCRETTLWRDTWYDSTLPYWFLDRTMLNTSILASSTSYRFKNGRFYGWEGVGCCPGTCAHVWHYAHAMARLFPELERDLRERVDFGLAMKPDGAIQFRGELTKRNIPAIDAQAGSILRAYREHQMSANSEFLKRVWPGVKRATDWLIAQDANGDGLIEGNQHNTLDTDWFGPVAWLSGLYLSALRAAEAMALELGDTPYAKSCRAIYDPGVTNLVTQLFDGEYFINKLDPKHPGTVNSGDGCEIDQVMGQSWAWQVGLGRVLPEPETKSALRSLWKYNFSPDVGPYRAVNTRGRWYAMAGEAGLLMCTFPRAGGKRGGFTGCFNECMNGFEYQVAGHMIWEGLVLEGLAVTRAVHDRYEAAKRNPWNEIECGDHYSRSMASYGVYLAACGFEYHGPNGHIGFVPRLTPENFKAAFTAAEGWGTFTQKHEGGSRKAEIAVKYGHLGIKTIALAAPEPASVAVTMNQHPLPCRHELRDGRLLITLATQLIVPAGQTLEIHL